MSKAFRLAIPFCLLPVLAATAAEPVLLGNSQLEWTAIEGVRGGQEASLYADAGTGEDVRLVRWRYNTEIGEKTYQRDMHIFVHAGTFTVTIGDLYREFGPGDFVMIPKGVEHAFGCEAAGTCVLVVHMSAALAK